MEAPARDGRRVRLGWMMVLPALIGLALLVLVVLAIVWPARDLGTRRPDDGSTPTRS